MDNFKDLEKYAVSSISAKALDNWKNLETNEKNDNAFELFGVIGEYYDEISSKDVLNFLKKNEENDVKILINSPGGSVFEGFAIYNMLLNHKKKVEVEIVGMAASAASIIAMAGTKIKAYESSCIMIHNSWNFAAGNKNDLRIAAELLDKVDDVMKDIYLKRINVNREKLTEMLDNETFIFANEAIELNLLDEIKVTKIVEKDDAVFAKRKIGEILSKNGITRSKQREWFELLKNKNQENNPQNNKNYAIKPIPDLKFMV